MILKNATVLNEKFKLEKLDIKVSDDKIDEIGSSLSGDDEIDLSGKTVIPGLIDIHIHGSMGADVCDGTFDALETMSKHLAQYGVTSFAPTTMSISIERLSKVMKNLGDNADKVTGSRIVGVNMEGPYFSKAKCGAQDPDVMHSPDVDEIKMLDECANGLIKLIDLAPELDGSIDFVKKMSGGKYVLSVAHTSANYDETMEGFKNGMTHTTHLYNAQTGYTHREPGVVGAVFDSETKPTAELICDGIHIHPAVIRTTFKILGDDRVVLISDALPPAGMPDGSYTLGGSPIIVVDGTARVPSGALAGSTTNVYQCVKNCVSFGIPFITAVKAATINPATVLGKQDEIGSIAEGKRADLLVLDDDMNIEMVIIGGKKVK